MADIVLGCDSNQDDASVMNTVHQGLEKNGHKVKRLEIGPSPFSQVAYTQEAKGKVGVYLMADSLFSFADGFHDLYALDIFVVRGGVGGGINSQQDFQTKTLGRDPDCNSVCDEWVGLTYPQMNQKANGKCVAVYGGTTPEEALQAALSALNGRVDTSGASNQSNSGSAVLIPDKTFYGLIKQIIGAIDGVFIIANNMAYLLSFKQLYEYRNEYEDYILELKPSEIVRDSIIRKWTTDGFYNAVEVTYADGIVKYQHDALVSTYGENVFYYEFPDDDEETAKAKANALLSAHVRDYSLDLQLNCLYNPNITVGTWIKVPKTFTKISGVTSKTSGELSEKNKKQEDKEKKLYKGVTIENMVEKIQKGEDGEKKKINHIVTSEGDTYDIEVSTKDYEIYFVQGYKLKWRANHSPIMNLHLKYGPDTPEDPVNATVGTGQAQSGGGGGYGSDCFYVCAIMPNNNAYINSEHTLAPGDLQKPEFQPQPQHYGPRCKKGSNLDKACSGKSPQEVYAHIRSKFGYCSYADSSSLWPCVSDMYDQACGANCGDTTRLLKCGFDAAGVKSWGVHIFGHYFNALELNGKVVCVDGTGSYDYSNTAGFPIPGKPAECCEPRQQATADTC